jgi:hypothetical protein
VPGSLQRSLLIALFLSIPLSITAAPASPEREADSFGVRTLFYHGTWTTDGGTEASRWEVLLLWNWLRGVSPEGYTGGQWSLFPLIMHSYDTYLKTSTWMIPFPIPLWFSAKQGEPGDPFWQTLRILVPLAVWSDSHTPLSEARTRFVLPFYRRVEEIDDPQDDVEPVRVSDWGLIPFVWGWKNDLFDHLHVAPPLFMWDPLYQWDHSERLWITPLYYQGRNRRGNYLALGPLWGFWNGDFETVPKEQEEPIRVVHKTRHFLFPLFLYSNEQRGDAEPYIERHILWPLFAWGDGAGRVERRFFPIWRRGTKPVEGGDKTLAFGLFPLYWRTRLRLDDEVVQSRDIVFPLYWNLRGPFNYRDRETGEIHQTDLEMHTNTLFPLWFRSTLEGEIRELHLLWPLYLSRYGPPPAEDERRFFACTVGLLLAKFAQFTDGDSEFRILGPLFKRERSGPEIHSNTLFYLFTTSRDPEAETARAALLWRLFEYTRAGDERGMRLLFLPWKIPLP